MFILFKFYYLKFYIIKTTWIYVYLNFLLNNYFDHLCLLLFWAIFNIFLNLVKIWKKIGRRKHIQVHIQVDAVECWDDYFSKYTKQWRFLFVVDSPDCSRHGSSASSYRTIPSRAGLGYGARGYRFRGLNIFLTKIILKKNPNFLKLIWNKTPENLYYL